MTAEPEIPATAGKPPETLAELRALMVAIARDEAPISLGSKARTALGQILDLTGNPAILSITALAELLGVNPSTLTRLSHSLGYSGFPAFQQVLLSASMSAPGEFYSRQARAALAAGSTTQARAAQLCRENQANIDRFVDQFDPAAFDAAVEMIMSAPRVAVYGIRQFHSLASFLVYGLRMIRADVVLIDANNLVWVAIEGPTSLLASACGEVDVIVGRGQHVGTGVDFCPEDAPAPSYFTDIVRYAVDDEGERARIVVRSEQLLAEPDGRISVWTLLVAEDGSYQAIESIGQGRALQAVDLGELSQSTGPAVMTGAAPEGGASTPDDLPPGLVPPSSSVAFVGTATGSRLVRFTSTATIEDIRAFYSSMLGEPDAAPGDQSPIWFTDGPTGIITVNLTGTDGSATVDVVLYDPVSSSN